MMKALFFIIQAVTGTLAIVALLQLPVGEEDTVKTLDDRVKAWVADSVAKPSLEELVAGGVRLSQDVWGAIETKADQRVLASDEESKFKNNSKEAFEKVEKLLEEQEAQFQPNENIEQ